MIHEQRKGSLCGMESIIHLAGKTGIQNPTNFLREKRCQRVKSRSAFLLQDHPTVHSRFTDLQMQQVQQAIRIEVIVRCIVPQMRS